MLDAFVAAVKEVFPNCLVQWEDFHKNTAFEVLDRYHRQIPSFNDDIQGTAAVALAGILAALRITGQKLPEQRIVYAGAGAAGVGIGRLVAMAMREESDDQAQIHAAQVFVDTRRPAAPREPIADPHKRPFALDDAAMAQYGFSKDGPYDLLEVVRHVGPTVLIGTTAQPGTFTERDRAEDVPSTWSGPMILPLSNPTSKVECTPAEAIRWSRGTGDCRHGHRLRSGRLRGQDPRHRPSEQRLRLSRRGAGVHPFGREEVNDSLFLAAARRLADCVGQDRLDAGAIYPDQKDLRNVAAHVATAVIGEVQRQQGEQPDGQKPIEQVVREAMWFPDYPTYA